MAVVRPCQTCNPCNNCAVRPLTLCAALKPEELDRVNTIVSRIQLESEQAVFYEADPAEYVYNVTEGIVRLSKMLLDGRRQITGFLYPGSFLGIAYADTYAYTAEAIGSLTLCRFPRRKLEELFDELPELEKRVLGIAANELMAAQEQMLLLGRKSSHEKVASFICHLLQHVAQSDVSAQEIDLPMSRTDIADYLGLTTETVSRTFSKFAREGILELPSTHHVIVRQPEVLAEVAEGDS